MCFDFLKTRSLKISHFPTVLLIVGYLIFWAEMYVVRSPAGQATFLAWALSGIIFIGMISLKIRSREAFWGELSAWWKSQALEKKVFAGCVLGLSFLILIIAARASLLPPHLPQEYDSLNYHITLPRQHLIAGSFAHLPWSVADLFMLPLDFAVAPYCLATPYPNKLVFYFFFLGILVLSSQIAWRLSRKNILSVLAVIAAVLGAHGLGIQAGIAMFDLIMLYLFLAALDSFLAGQWILAAIEFSFYCWSKSFIPLQVLAIAAVLAAIFFVLRKKNWQMLNLWVPSGKINFKTLAVSFAVSSLLIGGPFIAKSLYYAGTPLYPFAAGVLSKGAYRYDTRLQASILERGKECTRVRDQYGKGRGFKAFVEHFWILAVPEKGVNNRFDYPLGLSYLLVLVPFGFLFVENLQRRRVDVISWFCVISWASWWAGSQQSRFLYVPLVMMIILVLVDERFLRRAMLYGLLISLVLTGLSVARAHRVDFFRTPEQALRAKDKGLIEAAQMIDRSKPTMIDFEDAAFASFPVDIVQPGSIFILDH